MFPLPPTPLPELSSASSTRHPRHSAPVLPHVGSRHSRQHTVVPHATNFRQTRLQQPAPAADGGNTHVWNSPTLQRRKAAFTHKPSDHGPPREQTQQPSHQSPLLRRKKQRQQQQQRQQQWKAQCWPPPLHPDPAADDLDALAAQAASILTTHSTLPSADSVPLPSPIYSVPGDQPSGAKTAVSAAAAAAAAAALLQDRQPRYAVSDKLHLTQEAARDIAMRLRRAGPPRPGQPVLRIFRYGIDDLRLYKALDLAGLEGRVVVVDSMQFADAVVTTRNKRTGKAVNLAVARRAAAAAGVPCLQLKAVSAQRLLETLGPLLGLQGEPAAALGGQHSNSSSLQDPWGGSGAAEQQQGAGFGLRHVLQDAHGLRSQPRLLRWEEVEDGSDELLQLLWGQAAAELAGKVGTGNSTSGNSSAVAVVASARWLAWRAAQAGPASAAAVLELVRSSDVEDSRDGLVPTNPTQRAGERYRLAKPLRHGSRLRHKRLLRDLRLRQVPW